LKNLSLWWIREWFILAIPENMGRRFILRTAASVRRGEIKGEIVIYKWRAKRACRKIAWKYRHPQGQLFFSRATCPLCIIYIPVIPRRCRGCPLANRIGGCGCREFRTFMGAVHVYPTYPKEGCSLRIPPPEFVARAEFFERIVPILKAIPARRFTPKGWAYFGELDRSW